MAKASTLPHDEVAYLSTSQLSAAIRSRAISPREVVDIAIARVEALDRDLNAVVVRDFERARAAALAAETALARGPTGPLHGIPITVKEAFHVAGLPTTWGLTGFKDWRPSADAETVARLRAAGAIVIGKTNVPEELMDWQSYNCVYGVTRNPWDTGLTPGGSSGGAAAALSAGFVSIELGSDLAGSLRCPAHFCGVYSHRPSLGVVPMRGHAPPRVEADGGVDMGVAGPMARTSADLALSFSILANQQLNDNGKGLVVAAGLEQRSLRDFRVLVIEHHPSQRTDSEITLALSSVAHLLRRLGAKVASQSAALPSLVETLQTFKRVFRWSPTATDGSRIVTRYASLDWWLANSQRSRLQREWQALFEEFDVVMCPPFGCLAFTHDFSSSREQRTLEIDGARVPYDEMFSWISMASVLGLPATTAPIGFGKSGLPIGAQILGRRGGDWTTLSFASALERETGGFERPPVPFRRPATTSITEEMPACGTGSLR